MPISTGYPVAQMRGLFRNLARKALFTAATKLPLRSYIETPVTYRDWDDTVEEVSLLAAKNERKSFYASMLDFYVPSLEEFRGKLA